MAQIKMSELIAPKFYTVFNSVIHYKYMHYLLKGGRGSTKSNVIATCVIYMMLKNKHLCAAVFMKHSVRLRNGAFDLYRSVIKRMGLQRLFKISRSPMQITYVPTGQVIVFKGCDDPYKTKGIATSDNDMYFGILHFEELDQFNGISEVAMKHLFFTVTTLQQISSTGAMSGHMKIYLGDLCITHLI